MSQTGVRSTGVTPTRWRVIQTAADRFALIHFSAPIFLLNSSGCRRENRSSTERSGQKNGETRVLAKRSLLRKSADAMQVRATDHSIEECSIGRTGHESCLSCGSANRTVNDRAILTLRFLAEIASLLGLFGFVSLAFCPVLLALLAYRRKLTRFRLIVCLVLMVMGFLAVSFAGSVLSAM